MSQEALQLCYGKVKVMLTNFSHKYMHLNIAATVAYMDELMDVSNTCVLFNATKPASTIRSPQPAFSISLSLLKHQQEQLKALLLQYKDSLSSSSRIRQMLVAKHRIIIQKSTRTKFRCENAGPRRNKSKKCYATTSSSCTRVCRCLSWC